MTYTKKKASMLIENIDLETSCIGLKMVKNASLLNQRGIIFIRHYDTIIFAYNPKSKIAECNFNLSLTSNRQISNALRFFNVVHENIIDVSDGSKWKFRGSLN